MKPAKPTAAATPRRAAKTPGHKAIIRAVASFTAIEAGKSIRKIKNSLLGQSRELRKIDLADCPTAPVLPSLLDKLVLNRSSAIVCGVSRLVIRYTHAQDLR